MDIKQYKVSDKCEQLLLLVYSGQKESDDFHICGNSAYLELKPLWCH